MGKSRKLRQNKKNGRKSFRNLMTKSRKMMMTPFKNRFTRKIFGGATKTWVVTLEKDEATGSIPVVKTISVGNNKDNVEELSFNTEDNKWVMPVKEPTYPKTETETVTDPAIDLKIGSYPQNTYDNAVNIQNAVDTPYTVDTPNTKAALKLKAALKTALNFNTLSKGKIFPIDASNTKSPIDASNTKSI